MFAETLLPGFGITPPGHFGFEQGSFEQIRRPLPQLPQLDEARLEPTAVGPRSDFPANFEQQGKVRSRNDGAVLAAPR